jgi:outer membrane protein assembly factor BamB
MPRHGKRAPRWDKQLSSEVGLGVDAHFVYAVNDRGVVIAFSRDTGATAWNNNKLINRNLAAPVAVGSAVAVGDGQGYVHFLSPEDGRFVARVATGDSRVISAEPLADGHGAVFQTQAGEVVALTAE